MQHQQQQQHGQPYQAVSYHHSEAAKQDKKAHSISNSRSSSHESNKSHQSKTKQVVAESKYDMDEKDDIKQDSAHSTHGRLTSHIGYASASNTISPQDSNNNNNNNNNKSNDNDSNNKKNGNNYYNFTDATVKELSNSLGFEEEYVKMALVQSQGDITLAAEILFQMNEKTIKAMKKHEKEKRKKKCSIPNFNTSLVEEILGMKLKQIKKKWKRVICDKSKSELRSISRRECVNYRESSSESSSSSESDSSDSNANKKNLSFYNKNKKEMETLCQCASNLLFILCLFSKWKASKAQNVYFHVIIDEFLPHYGHIQLINDLQHLHIYHWDHCELFQEFEKIMGQCQVSKCVSFHRHFRDRLQYQNDSKRYKLYHIRIENEHGKYLKNELFLKEIVCKQWMDEIHCYLLHSLARFEVDFDEESEEEEDHENSKNSASRSISTSRASRNSAYLNMSDSQSPSTRNHLSANYGGGHNPKLVENERLLRQRREELIKYGYGRSYGRNQAAKSKKKKEEKKELALFEWQSTLNVKHKNINPRYDNMRDEILNNPYYKLTMLEYNELHFKSQQIAKTWIKKKIKAKDKYVGIIGYKNNGEKEEKLRIEKGGVITADMIVAIKLLTDYDKLQYELKKCLRSANSDHDLSNLYWWRNMISIVVCLYGHRMKKNKFFYGLSDKLELERYCGFGLFAGPLSLTVSLSVAKMYANENGMLLQIGNGHSWLRSSADAGNGKYFDVSCLSDFKNEHEILTMLLTTRIFMVSLNQYIDTNINNINDSLFAFISKLFAKCVFSMNYELEYLLIQLITAHLNHSQSHKYFHAFHTLCLEKENLLLWDISYGLQDFFMVSTQYDDDFDDDSMTMNNGIDSEDDGSKLLISFEKINELFVNLKSLTLINHILSREVFYQFIDYLNKNAGNVSFEIITFYFPKYKKLPRHLKINQLRHVWQKYLNQHKWHIVAYKYGYSLSPMIVIQRVDSDLLPFIGQSKNNYLNQFVKITK